MEYTIQNFRVPMRIKPRECPIFEDIRDFELSFIVRVSCPNMVDYIRVVIREHVLIPSAPRILFPSQIL